LTAKGKVNRLNGTNLMQRFILPEINPGELVSLSAWRAAFAEFTAVFLFVFLGAGAVLVSGSLTGGEMDVSRLVMISAAHGLAITMLAYATINISGGHINPAVTFAALVARQISVARGFLYVSHQLAGAAAGAVLLLAVVPGTGDTNLGGHSLAPEVSLGAGLLTETILTFGLVFVIFTTAMDDKGLRNLAPLTIGLAVLVESLFGIPITGASMNPARSFGPALVSWEWSNHWLYWAGPLLGGALAALTCRCMFWNQRG